MTGMVVDSGGACIMPRISLGHIYKKNFIPLFDQEYFMITRRFSLSLSLIVYLAVFCEHRFLKEVEWGMVRPLEVVVCVFSLYVRRRGKSWGDDWDACRLEKCMLDLQHVLRKGLRSFVMD